MRRGAFTRGMASIFAFGHSRGLAGQGKKRAAENVPVRTIVPAPPSL
jgi:hypothetical protein